MNIFDIIGPVMVGPSSSHTAGAVKIGYVSQKLLGEPIIKAEILLYGSFLATGKGHGTTFALVAGLLGMHEDDSRIPESIEIAKEQDYKKFYNVEVDIRKSLKYPPFCDIMLIQISGKNSLDVKRISNLFFNKIKK